jgi:hypothetical protein
MTSLLLVGPGAQTQACAQAPHVVWIAGDPRGEVAGRARRWSQRLRRALAQRGADVTSEVEEWAHGPAGIEEERVERLARVEVLLAQAQAARVQLQFREAFARLVEAEQVVLSVLDVPGASAWYAEVELAVAVTASEIGASSLASAALARASTIDAGRVLRAAEAPPDLLARALALAREIAIGPRGRFELRADVPGATAFLDGRRLGNTPLHVEASVGTHVLCIEAPGHRPWARRIDVFEGARPPIEVALAPDPALQAARQLRAAADARDVAGVLDALGALARAGRAPQALWLVEVGAGAIDRAVVVACRPAGCSGPIRVDVGRVESVLPHVLTEPGALAPPALEEARRWLDEPIPTDAPPPQPPPWWEEPWIWAVAGALSAAGAAAAIGAAWPQPSVQTTVILDAREPFAR